MKKIAFIFCTCLIFNAYADDCPDGVLSCGVTDDGLSWEISEVTDENNHTIKQLTITGTGAMKDYTRRGETRAPWRDDTGGAINAAPGITKIVIGDGITSIGGHAFEDMWNVTSISLPEGLISIGQEAFLSCQISEIELPNSVEYLGAYAFYATNLEHIDLPENLETIQGRVFGSTTLLSDITIPEGVNINHGAFEGEDYNAYVQNVYCSGDNASCQALKNRKSMAGKVQFYHSDGDAYFYNNRWYASPNDIIGDNHIKKRIYTIEEANKISKPAGNTLKIKYR